MIAKPGQLSRTQALAVLVHREDEATRDMESAYGLKLPRAARKAKVRFLRALAQRRNVEQGYEVRVVCRGLAERLVAAQVQKREVNEALVSEAMIDKAKANA